MNSNDSHDPRHDPRGHNGEHGTARPPHRAHPHHRRAHIPHHPHRREGIGRWFACIGRILFRKRNGRVSAVKITTIVFTVLASFYVILVSGLLPFDVAGPIVKRALEAKLGQGTHVKIGATSLGQNASGQPVLNVRDIVIKGRSGVKIATAPRAEIVLDSGMLVGNFRAKRIDLIDAIMTLRIDEQGRIGITAEDQPKKPPVAASQAAQNPAARNAPEKPRNAAESIPFVYPELAAWLDRLEQSGLDGIALSEVGLRQGTLVVESAKQNRRWIFANTNFLISRPLEGGVTLNLSSGNAGDAWSLNATIGSLQNGARAVDIVARDISPEDVMLAAGVTGSQFSVSSRISGILRAQIGQDGQLLGGGLRASAGP